MNAHDRAVDHLHLAIVGLDDRVHHPVPDARFAPAVEAVVDGSVRTVALRQVAPGAARAQDVEHAVENLPVVLGLRPAAVHGKQRLDNAPLGIREIVAHDPSSDVSQLESLFASHA